VVSFELPTETERGRERERATLAARISPARKLACEISATKVYIYELTLIEKE